jgi:hypothetical protein
MSRLCELDRTIDTLSFRSKDLTGQRFGDLVVKNWVGLNSSGSVLWNCECDCGRYRLVPTNWLTGKHTTCCGCKYPHQEVEIGQRFGKLIVVGKATTKKGLHWLCRCDCGRDNTVYQSNLIHGASTACRYCGHYKKQYSESAFNKLYGDYQRQSVKRSFEFSLTREEFKSLVSGDCHYCGEPPAQGANLARTYGVFLYNGIDRLDNDLGYHFVNCVPCCAICNHMKWTLTKDQFLNRIARIAQKRLHKPQTGERIVVETSISNPIVLTSAS